MRHFRILFAGALVNSIGSGLTAFALAVHLSAKHGTAWRAVAGTPRVVAAVAIVSALTLALGTLQVLVKPILLPNYTPAQMGTAETVTACGMVAGGALVSLLKGVSPRNLLFGGIAGVSVAMAATGFRPEIWWVVAGCFSMFVCLSCCNAGAEVVVRTAIPNELQGRAWGVIGLVSQLGFLVAYAAAGPLADKVFEPLLRDGGALVGSLGGVFGRGPGRGTAVLVTMMGLVALGLAPFARNSAFGINLNEEEEKNHDLAPVAL